MPKRIAMLKASLGATAEDIGELIEILENSGYRVKGVVFGVYAIEK